MKASGILTNQRLSVISHSVGDENLTLAHAEARTLITHLDSRPLTDIPPMNQDDLEKMYLDFRNGKSPVEVIAENGFNLKLVEYEYIRFCRLNGLNLKSLASDLIKKYSLGSDMESGSFIQKILRDGITSNDEIKKLFEFVSNSSYSKGELAIIERMRNGDPVANFRPLICRLCQRPIRGALIEYEIELGKKIIDSMGTGIMHTTCWVGLQPKLKSMRLPIA